MYMQTIVRKRALNPKWLMPTSIVEILLGWAFVAQLGASRYPTWWGIWTGLFLFLSGLSALVVVGISPTAPYRVVLNVTYASVGMWYAGLVSVVVWFFSSLLVDDFWSDGWALLAVIIVVPLSCVLFGTIATARYFFLAAVTDVTRFALYRGVVKQAPETHGMMLGNQSPRPNVPSPASSLYPNASGGVVGGSTESGYIGGGIATTTTSTTTTSGSSTTTAPSPSPPPSSSPSPSVQEPIRLTSSPSLPAGGKTVPGSSASGVSSSSSSGSASASVAHDSNNGNDGASGAV